MGIWKSTNLEEDSEANDMHLKQKMALFHFQNCHETDAAPLHLLDKQPLLFPQIHILLKLFWCFFFFFKTARAVKADI